MLSAPASRAALGALRDRLTEVSGGLGSADDLSALGSDLYAVGDLLAAQPRLRRTLGDPATDVSVRTGLVGRLFEGKINASALTVVSDAVGLRWSSPWDLSDALELMGDESYMAAAESAGQLDEVEDELFRFGRMLDGEDRLVTLLDERGVPAEQKAQLLSTLLSAKVRAETLALLQHAAGSARKRSIELSIDDLLEAANARQSRSVAKVVSAVELTDEQISRLAAVLTRMYGRQISIRTSVEPHVQGGLLIRLGDEIIDGTLSARFAAARAALSL